MARLGEWHLVRKGAVGGKDSFYSLSLDAAWDKPAAERIELTLQ